MTSHKAFAAIFLFLLRVATMGVADEILQLDFADRLRVSERSNLSRRENDRYIGLTNQQITSYLSRISGEVYEGRELRFQRTLRDMNEVGRRVDGSQIAVIETSDSRGFASTTGSPRYLGIPTLPGTPVSEGAVWEAPAEIFLRLPFQAAPVLVPVIVHYRYAGRDTWDGEAVHVLEAQFATRYPPPVREDEEPLPVRTDIGRITGRHTLTILLPADSRAPLFIRDELEEQIELVGKPTVLNTGHVLTFVHGLSADGQQAVTRELEIRLQSTDDVEISRTPVGARITVGGIRFVADQAVILPEERERLSSLTDALMSVDGARFLVVGHTADVGSVESQVDLSWERARVMVREFVTRGLDPGLFDIEGRGGSEPIASNATETGRARNRRVEIYVLEE